jgi:hypothetical protein
MTAPRSLLEVRTPLEGAGIGDLCVRPRSLALLGGLAVVVFVITAVTMHMFRARPMAVSIRVHKYLRQAERLCAFVAISNAAAAPVAVPLRFHCQVERAGSSTNYVADTRYTIFLQPREDAVLSRTNYAVALPPDTGTWKVRVQIRRQTSRELLVNALYWCGVRDSAFLSRLSGRPRKDEKLKWTECWSSSFEVPRAPSSQDKQ